MEIKVENLLNVAVTDTKIPVIDKAYPDVWPCVTYHFYNENGALFGSGIATEESASCQVDIWYKVKTNEIKLAINSIKQEIIKDRYFTHPLIESTYESATKIYHTFINFKLIKESEV